MNQVIIYQTGSGGMAVIYPYDHVITLQEQARRFVPAGVPYWVAPSSVVPSSRAQRNAWEIDPEVMGLPTGVGGGE
jgi:hypothetical protein